MYIHGDDSFKIYFGSDQDKISKENLMVFTKEKDIRGHKNFVNLKNNVEFNNLFFLNQVHGCSGLVVLSDGYENKINNFNLQSKQEENSFYVVENLNKASFLDDLTVLSEDQVSNFKNFVIDGDFLVTDVKHLAVGVLTADCLPIVFFDRIKNVVAVAHAGWRGSIGKIAVKTIESMQNFFNSDLKDISIFFGPCIGKCCYRVADNFAENLKNFNFTEKVLQKKEDGLYFDLASFNILLLQEFGVKRENIFLEYNLCTSCDKNFYSYRRGDKDNRQMTVACLV